ncbi:FkbM family methyltransferase [Hoeflea sp.]|uniref:FkbM family methyltransferase n=1 Tax=Hoeflea sp. TaxID=1940281 RepID=UPI003B027C33
MRSFMIDKLHSVAAKGLRQWSTTRRGYRTCLRINRSLLKRGAAPVKICKMADGTKMKIDLRSHTEWYAYWSGWYDDYTVGLICKLLRMSTGHFLDVGANIGLYAVRVAAQMPSGRSALCFEPVPGNILRLRENVDLNGASGKVLIWQKALSDKNGTVSLVLREDFETGSQTGNASIAISKEADLAFNQIEVETQTFDSICDQYPDWEIPVAKMDIEGHEDLFLRGASNWLDRDRPIIFTEINNWYFQMRGTTSTDAFRASLSNDYRFARLRRNGALEWIAIEMLARLPTIDNVVLCPREKTAMLENATTRL